MRSISKDYWPYRRPCPCIPRTLRHIQPLGGNRNILSATDPTSPNPSFVVGGKVVLTKNPRFVNVSGLPTSNIQQINFIPAPTVPVEDFESGALDAAVITTPSDYAYALQHMKTEVHKAPLAAINYLGWDHSVDASPLDNSLVREAVALAINRAPIVNPVLNNMVGATTTFAYPGFPTYRDEHNPYGYSLTKARHLLAKAGYPGGKGIGLLYLYAQAGNTQSIDMAEAVASELKDNLGLKFKIDPTNTTEWGNINWGGIYKGVLPGYSIDYAVANWNNTLQWPMASAVRSVGDAERFGNRRTRELSPIRRELEFLKLRSQ